MKVFFGIIILIIVLYNLCKRYGDKMLVAVLVALPIVGLFCGRALVLGSTGFWLWLFALAGEIFALFVIGYSFSEDGSDTDSTYPKVLTVIGTAF